MKHHQTEDEKSKEKERKEKKIQRNHYLRHASIATGKKSIADRWPTKKPAFLICSTRANVKTSSTSKDRRQIGQQQHSLYVHILVVSIL